MKPVDIVLSQNSGFQWVNEGKVFVKGYSWIHDQYYTAKTLAYYLSDKSIEKFIEIISLMNGCYAIVYETDHYCIAVVDRLRSIPLFYTDNNQMITDDPININPRQKMNIDKVAFAELVSSGMFTANNRTLYSHIQQIPAGTYGIISKEIPQKLELRSYYIHSHSNVYQSLSQLYQKIDKLSDSVFQRLIQSVQGKTIIIPLSGGYDSRYIASMLVKLHYKKIVCYTYGKLDSYEVRNSKAIAKSLGLKWFFIEYNEKRWSEIEKSILKDFCFRSFLCSSIPHLQEIIALMQLTTNTGFPSDGVIVPGFCGDLIAGSFLLSEREMEQLECNKNWISTYIIKKNFSLEQLNQKYNSYIKEDIEECIFNYNIDISSKEGVQSFLEAWFTVHRPSKYVIQSNRLYELFGFEWRMPLWDQEFVDFWYKVPRKYRIGKFLYEKWLFDKLFIPMDIDFKKINTVAQHEHPSFKRMKDYIRKIDGAIWLITGIKLRDKGDPNGFKYLARYLFKQLKSPYQYNYTNQNINFRTAIWSLENYLGPYDTLYLYKEITKNEHNL